MIKPSGWKKKECYLHFGFSIVLIRKVSMGQKAWKNLPSVRMRLYVTFEGDAWRNVSVMLGHTETDRQA